MPEPTLDPVAQLRSDILRLLPLTSFKDFQTKAWEAKQIWEDPAFAKAQGFNPLERHPDLERYIPNKFEHSSVADLETYSRPEEIEALAQEYGLNESQLPAKYQGRDLGINAVDARIWLRHSAAEADPSHWHPHYGRPMTAQELRLEFAARRVALDAMIQLDHVPNSKGDVSYFAEAIRGPINKAV